MPLLHGLIYNNSTTLTSPWQVDSKVHKDSLAMLYSPSLHHILLGEVIRAIICWVLLYPTQSEYAQSSACAKGLLFQLES